MAGIRGDGAVEPPAVWTFASGRDFVIALPVGTDAAVLAAIADLPRHAMTIERLVATVPLNGPGAVTDFAAVVAGASVDGDGVPISVVVRGDVAVQVHSVGGSRRFTDRDIRPWLLADFRSVTGLSVGAADEPAPPFAELGLEGEPIGQGADGARLDWVTGAGDGEVFVTAASRSVAREDALHDTVLRPTSSVEDTVLRPGGAVEDTVLGPGASEPSRRDDDTVLFGRRRARRPTAEAGVPADGADAGGGGPVESENATAARPASTGFAFRIGAGETRPLDAVYLIGRKPRYARVAPADTDVRLIAVPSPTTEVSSTHLELRAQGSAIVVTDLRSTNGTIVHPARGRRVRLRPGESLVVMPGTRVDIGDDTIIEVFAQTSAPEPISTPDPPTRRPTT
ncbi:FHA domain-containing protein [Glaciibacter flavus]|uniref:FHA domain-containing protein n=1 Tax=Orlajensenia flava TaxID=2565934 RepID=A0A4S4G0H1_9MICO|nr:FHA domain-containing protein [Glaciibacter flavus]THG35596.1 FHA domain-containing protein [Glaciibacter flavus]